MHDGDIYRAPLNSGYRSESGKGVKGPFPRQRPRGQILSSTSHGPTRVLPPWILRVGVGGLRRTLKSSQE